jgi:hypothetical protein
MTAPILTRILKEIELWPVQAGRLMNEHPRQTWLVPLLAVPLSDVALSACSTEMLALCAPDEDLQDMRRQAAAVAALARAVAGSDGVRGLTDQEALLLHDFTSDYVGLGRAALWPPAALQVGMNVDPTLPMGPVLRLVSHWVASDAVPVPMAALLMTRALHMGAHPPAYLPRMDGYYAPLVRAIDRRLFEQGVATSAVGGANKCAVEAKSMSER